MVKYISCLFGFSSSFKNVPIQLSIQLSKIITTSTTLCNFRQENKIHFLDKVSKAELKTLADKMVVSPLLSASTPSNCLTNCSVTGGRDVAVV